MFCRFDVFLRVRTTPRCNNKTRIIRNASYDEFVKFFQFPPELPVEIVIRVDGQPRSVFPNRNRRRVIAGNSASLRARVRFLYRRHIIAVRRKESHAIVIDQRSRTVKRSFCGFIGFFGKPAVGRWKKKRLRLESKRTMNFFFRCRTV